MNRVALPLLGIIALTGQTWAQAYNVRKDSQLSKPITLSMKYGPIRDVLKAIQKQAGVNLSAASVITDLKVTLFVKDIPGNVLLDRIGSVLNCEWSNDGGNRVLKTNATDTKQISDYLAAEDVVLRAKAEDDLKQLVEKSENEASTGTTGESPVPQRVPRHRRGTGFQESLPTQITKVFSNANSGDMDSFWAGEILHFETPDTTPTVNADAPPPTSNAEGGRPRLGTTVVYCRYDYWGTHTLQFGTSKTPVVPQPFAVPSLTQPSDNLAELAFGKKVAAWPEMNLADGEDNFSKPMSPDPQSAVGFKVKTQSDNPDTSSLPRRTQTDLLEAFATRSGIPVVSDAFRVTLPPETPDPTGSTPLEWLKSFSGQFNNFVQIKDGVATVRQGGFWRLRQYEIPEESLKTMDKDPATLTLLDYANFFYNLTPGQARSFGSATPPEVDFPIDSIIPDIPALRVIGSLSSSFPTNGNPVPVSQLGSDAQALIAQAIAESVFSGESWQPNAEAKRLPFYVTLQKANVSQPEGTVPGISLQFVLPIGQIVDYQIPLKLSAS